MSWWILTIAVWLAVSFGSVVAVYVAVRVREQRRRKRIAADDATFEALMATLDPELRTPA